MNDPRYSSMRVTLLIVLIGAFAYGVYSMGHQNALEGTGKVFKGAPNEVAVVPNPGVSLGTKLPLTPNFAALCTDGQPHIELISPKSGDFKITNLQVAWQDCNIQQIDPINQPGVVSIKLIHDSATTSRVYYKNFTGYDYNLTPTPTDHPGTEGTRDDGSENLSLAVMNGNGGRYKIHLEAFGSATGQIGIYYPPTGATSDSDWLIGYEDDSYVQTSGNITIPTTGYFRYPKNPSVLTVTLYGAGGGGGGAGGKIPWWDWNHTVYGGSGGGGEAGGSKTTILSSATPGQVASLIIGTGGNGGMKGHDAILTSDGQDLNADAHPGNNGGTGGSTEFKIPVFLSNAWSYSGAAARTAVGGAGGGGGGGATYNGGGSSGADGIGGIGGSTSNNGAGNDGQPANGEPGLGGTGPGGAGGMGGEADDWVNQPSQAGMSGKITINWVPLPAPRDGSANNPPVQGN